VFFNNVEEVKRCLQQSLMAQVIGGENREGAVVSDEWVKDCIARARRPWLGWEVRMASICKIAPKDLGPWVGCGASDIGREGSRL